MDQRIFQEFRTLIHKESGIYLTDEKESLLTNRLSRRLRATGTQTPQEYLQLLSLDTNGEEIVQLIDAISTNVTHFFREPEHFTRLKEILVKFADTQPKEIKIWCAASSTGEEPYTLAMVAHDVLKSRKIEWKILATDICTRVLEQANRAEYSDQHIQALPENVRRESFERDSSNPELPWRIRPHLRERVAFRKLNLSKFPYPLKGNIDIVFCRNVMIYFDHALRQNIVEEAHRLLNPGGYLFVSHSENLLSVTTSLIPERGSVFRKPSVGQRTHL